VADSLFDRVPPHSLEAERAVLGACLLDRDALLTATEMLTPEDFYDLHHRMGFEIMETMSRKDRPVDLLTFWEEVGRRDLAEKLGGQSFMAALVDGVPTTANVAWHAEIVRDKAVRRRLIQAGGAIVRLAYAEDRELGTSWTRRSVPSSNCPSVAAVHPSNMWEMCGAPPSSRARRTFTGGSPSRGRPRALSTSTASPAVSSRGASTSSRPAPPWVRPPLLSTSPRELP
jgi:hypothetical protein